MFESFDNTQRFADAVKRIVNDSRSTDRQKRDARRTINEFEKFSWAPDVMARAAEHLGISGFYFDEDGDLQYEDPDQAPTLVGLVIETLLQRYMDAITLGVEMPTLTIKEAAIYLGVTVDAVKNYMYRRGHGLRAVKRGHDLMFTKEALDNFQKPRAGRPRMPVQ